MSDHRDDADGRLGVLFVCMGNICRSPTAEGVFRRRAEDAGLLHRLVVDSAGTHGYHEGCPPDTRAIAIARRRGYDLAPLRARLLLTMDFQRFDYILGMDAHNLRAMQSMRPPGPTGYIGRLLDFAPVFRNTNAMGFILGYGAHCFELYGIRTWLVAFWTFVAMKHSNASLLTPVVVSVLFSVLAMPASILGNECALRFGRHRAITAVMFSSAFVALLIGAFADQSPWLLLPLVVAYAITVPADSGALTSGMTMAADPNYRGATMAIHSTVGFSLSALGAWALGVALDAAGGPSSATAWTAAFAVLAAGILLGPVALYWSRRVSVQA